MKPKSRLAFDILIVDDEDSVRENLAIFLEDEGFSVVEAITAELALEQIIEKQFRYLIVDMRLPAMDGSELIRKAHAMDSQQRFLIHTASTEFSLPEELKLLGVRSEDVFHKPLTDMTVITQALERLSERDDVPAL